MSRRPALPTVLWYSALAALLLSLGGGRSLSAAPARQAETCVRIGQLDDGRALWAGDCGPVVEPIPSDTPPPTDLPPTDVPPSETPTGPIAAYPDAPLCLSHDNRAYHSLWDAARGCHYDHHHGDNPHEADAVLGTEIYGIMGGEISYPWMTYSDAGMENNLKHAGYFWHVRTVDACSPNPAGLPVEPCITSFRVLVHQHATGRDATVRYHSYVVEYATSDGGYALLGGWADYGDLHSPESTIVVDVPGNSDSRTCAGVGRHKQHAPEGSQRNGLIWYGASLQGPLDECGPRGFVTVSVTIMDPWDYTSQSEPARFDDYQCYNPADPHNGNCRQNATTLRPHLIGLNMQTTIWNGLIDADGDGRVTWSGNADRYGRLLPSACEGYSTDCAPVIFRNVKAGQQYLAPSSATSQSFRDYDVYFAGRSAGWNQPVP
jgi:hypothetical protein